MHRAVENHGGKLGERPICTVWAPNIFVEKRSNGVFTVYGAGRIMGYPPMRSLGSDSDLLAPFWSYAAGKAGRTPAHMEFLRVRTDDELLNFIRKFGPVEGQLRRQSPRSEECINVEVQQHLADAKKVQNTFRRLFQLLTGLRKRDLCTIASSCEGVEGFEPADKYGRRQADELAMGVLAAAYDHDLAACCLAGHALLCQVLQFFPVRLVPFEGGAVDLPIRKENSILPELMYMLREDYRSDRQFDFCANEKCQIPFRVTRKDRKYCHLECARRAAQRRYWHKWHKDEGGKCRLAQRQNQGT